jgi:hypothetical protein
MAGSFFQLGGRTIRRRKNNIGRRLWKVNGLFASQSDLYSRVKQNEKQRRPSFKNQIPPTRRAETLKACMAGSFRKKEKAGADRRRPA